VAGVRRGRMGGRWYQEVSFWSACRWYQREGARKLWRRRRGRRDGMWYHRQPLSERTAPRRNTGAARAERWYQTQARTTRADDEAKAAAEGPHGSTDAALLPEFTQNPIPRSVAAIQQAFEARTRQRAIKRWRRSKRYNTAKAIDDSMPSNKFLKLVHSMPRNQSTLLIWLRTGYAPLNYHLHRIHAIESPECAHCRTETAETTKHFLVDCPAHERARRALQKALGYRKAGEIPFLLSSPEAIAPLMKYIDDTGRFTDRLGTLTAAAPTQPQGAEGAAAAA
jgi:hypothetical protein